MATPNPTPAKMKIAIDHGMHNVAAIADASRLSGLEFYILLALVEGESGGKNIYGHDRSGYFSDPGETPVTMLNWHKFYAEVVVNGHTSNGVGPVQITYRGHFDRMLERGLRPWVPRDSIRYGAELLKQYIESTDTLAQAFTVYNAGSLRNGVNRYGQDQAARADAWKLRFWPNR